CQQHSSWPQPTF
nr:immunoglobulin light chain junction region [Macaca mulatta]